MTKPSPMGDRMVKMVVAPRGYHSRENQGIVMGK